MKALLLTLLLFPGIPVEQPTDTYELTITAQYQGNPQPAVIADVTINGATTRMVEPGPFVLTTTQPPPWVWTLHQHPPPAHLGHVGEHRDRRGPAACRRPGLG